MAKISRKKNTEKVTDSDNKIHEINTETGDVKAITPVESKPEAWHPSKKQDFDKCKMLVRQITDKATCIVDEKNITTVANALATFHEAGRELFNAVCVHQTVFESDELKEIFDTAIRTARYKRPIKFFNICEQFGLIVLSGTDDFEYYLVEGIKPVQYTSQLDNEQILNIQEYGFVEIRNQYYFSDVNSESKRVTLKPLSNFVMKVLYHIHRGKDNKRVISLINNKGHKVILEVATKDLGTLSAFRNLTEGQGDYTLNSKFADAQLQMIKKKLFSQERPSTQIEVLGWNVKHCFFAFCNGLYYVNADSAQFYPVDEYGIVNLKETHFHIPAHPGSDEHSYQNEKRIFFIEAKIDFKTWSKHYTDAFGMLGMLVLTFNVATIFSDFIFKKKNNFPMLFLYGEGGSGKGTMCEFSQYLYGVPQPPLKLTEKANTDKSKIRKFATYCNMPVRLEEFDNTIDKTQLLTLQNLYDRFGYERSSNDSRFGTETVPVRSTVMILGNQYPVHDPLLQRLILADADVNKRTDKEVNAFRELQKLNDAGITQVLIEILKFRQQVETTWMKFYQDELDDLRTTWKEIDVPTRMFENIATMLATWKCLHAAGLPWPIEYQPFRDFLKHTLTSQEEKRSSGAVVQEFWNIFLTLVRKGLLRDKEDFTIDGSNVYIRWTETHAMYMEEHLRKHRQPGLATSTMLNKLKLHPSYKESKAGHRFGAVNTSCQVFDASKIGIDLAYVVNQQRLKIDKEKAELIDTPADKAEKQNDADRIYRQAQENKAQFEAGRVDNPPPPDDEPDFLKNKYGFEK